MDPGQGIEATLDLRAVRPVAAGGASTAEVAITGPAGTMITHMAGRAGTVDCTDPVGYGDLTMITATRRWMCLLPKGCIWSASPTPAGARTRPDRLRWCSRWMPPGPQRPIVLSVKDFDADRSIEPIFSIPELSGFTLKHGPPDRTDCDDPDGYRIYRRVATIVEAADLPVAFCVIGEDEAGNVSPPHRQVITGR